MDIDFENLIQLQHFDYEIQKASLFLEDIPSRIDDIDKKIELSSQTVIQAKDKLAQNQKKRRDLEAETQDIKTQISRYKHQLNEVKTNREYTSLLSEIEEAQRKIDRLEEEIIGEMLSADDIEKEIKEVTKKAAEEKDIFSKKKESLNQEAREMEDQRKKLLQEKEKLIPNIPANQMSLYQKIFKKKNGIALSEVKDEFCTMCHMRIRPQMLNELIAKSKLHICENCGRILYLPKKSA